MTHLYFFERIMTIKIFQLNLSGSYLEMFKRIDQESFFKYVLTAMLTNDDRNETYKNSKVEMSYFNYCRIICAEFIRKEFKSLNFSEHKIPRHWTKECKEFINCEVVLMRQLWKMINLLSIYIPTFLPLPLYFYLILKEKKLISLTYSNEIDKTATKIITNIQLQNKKLFFSDSDREYINCFSPDTESYTHDFIDLCHKKLESEDFYTEYRKFGNLRMAFTTVLKKSHCQKYSNNTEKLEHRGR